MRFFECERSPISKMTSVVKTFTVALCVLFFIFPGLAAVLLFIAFPVLYTIYLGFTNYSSFNLLSFERATEVLLQRVIIDSNSEREFQVVQDNDQYRIFFPAADNAFITAPIRLDGAAMQVSSAPIDSAHDYPVLARRDALKLRKAIAEVSVITPLGVRLQNAGLRRFAEVQAEYQRGANGELIATVDGTRLQADHTTGFYTASSGARVSPGWRVWVGADNFSRIANSAGIRGPIIRIFVWTFTFAILSVGLTFALGVLLATVLQWPQLAGRGVYRVLLILPYAVPAFISILIFRGLFNQNFGEINLLLEALFNIRPEWFTDGLMARVMIVIVNVWLGYPYMMLLAMGFLQSVPADHKRAASLETSTISY